MSNASAHLDADQLADCFKHFGNNVVVPVIKNRSASSNDIINYGPVSIEPIFTKLFEQCLVPVLDPLSCFHSNQFGFVKNGGCD